MRFYFLPGRRGTAWFLNMDLNSKRTNKLCLKFWPLKDISLRTSSQIPTCRQRSFKTRLTGHQKRPVILKGRNDSMLFSRIYCNSCLFSARPSSIQMGTVHLEDVLVLHALQTLHPLSWIYESLAKMPSSEDFQGHEWKDGCRGPANPE